MQEVNRSMKKLIELFVAVAFILTLAAPVYAANQEEKKAGQPDRLDGRVQNINKATSEFQMRVGNVVRTVVWTSKTQWTYRNGPGSADNLKDGIRVICVGKFEGLKLVADRVDFREATK